MKHSKEFFALVESARVVVNEVSVEEAPGKIANGAALIDIREDHEWEKGHAAGAVHIGRGVLERDIIQSYPDKARELLLYCRGGMRSVLSAESLQKMGYVSVFSISGGWRAWRASGAPEIEPDTDE